MSSLDQPDNLLAAQTVSSSFDQLLYIDHASGLAEAALRTVSTETTKSALQLCQEKVLVKSDDTDQAAAFEVQQEGGTSIFKVDATTLDVTLGDDLLLNTDSSAIKLGIGADFTITHDGTTGATLAGNPITITSAGAATWSTSSGALTLTSAAAATWSTSAGALTIDSAASTLTLDGHAGVTVQSSYYGDIKLDSAVDIVLDAAGGNFEFKDAGTAQLTIDVDGTAGDIDITLMVDGDDLVFNQYDGTEVMRITDTARVGIGIDAPDTNLHVWDGDAGSISLTTNAIAVLESAAHTRLQLNAPDTYTPGIIFNSPTYQDQYGIHSHLAAAGTGNMQFEVSNSTVMTLQDDGDVRRVGIGYTAPQGELHVMRHANSVDGSDQGEGQIYISGKQVWEHGGSRIAALYFGCAEGGGWEGAAIRACASDDYDDNDWPTRLGFWTQTDGAAALTEHFRIDEDGTLTGTDTNGIGSISDVRIKRDIEDYSGGLAFLKQLQPRTFRFKNQSRHGIKDENFISKGFIADEVEVVDSSWVKLHHINVDDQDREYVEDTDGVLKQIPFGAKDAVYVSAIQEMQKVIEELSAKVTVLENA